jgi:hypothetical protein
VGALSRAAGPIEMESWRRYLELRVKAKTGLTSAVLTSPALALLVGILTAAFVLVTAFVWLAEKYDPLTAALVLCGLFLLLTIIALIACAWAHNIDDWYAAQRW